MIDYKDLKAVRLTERDEYGNANIIGVDSADLQLNLNFEELNLVTDALNKLADYEESDMVAEAERMRAENEKLKTEVSLEDIEKLYWFLQGEVPECLTLQTPPNLTKEQAFSVIYYLQEILHVIPDKYEKCCECKDLYDADSEGVGRHCGGCLAGLEG